VHGAVEVVGVADRIQRIADRDLVTDDEHALVGSCEQPAVGLGIATRGLVKTLAAGETVGSRTPVLPVAILVDRPALELPDADVVEELLLDQRHVAALECDPGGLERASEPGVHAGVQWLPPQLHAKQRRILAASLGQGRRDGGIAVDPSLLVQHRLTMAGEDVKAHARP